MYNGDTGGSFRFKEENYDGCPVRVQPLLDEACRSRARTLWKAAALRRHGWVGIGVIWRLNPRLVITASRCPSKVMTFRMEMKQTKNKLVPRWSRRMCLCLTPPLAVVRSLGRKGPPCNLWTQLRSATQLTRSNAGDRQKEG